VGPDVSYNADSDLIVYNGQVVAVSGTSCSAPCWAGIVALADQGRAALGFSPLGSAQAEQALYSGQPWGHAVTYGASYLDGFNVSAGLGSPYVPSAVAVLASWGGPQALFYARLFNALNRQ
jgi:subtilase family serine protease